MYSQARNFQQVVRGSATLHYHYLLHLRNFSVFYCIFSLQSLIVTNDFRMWTPRTRWISRTCWTLDCFVSRKVRLLKIIKTDCVINITRAYTEIFLKADTKKTTLLTHQRQVYFSAMCNSQRQSTVFENSSENFIGICFHWIKIPIETWLQHPTVPKHH